jgi:hypothetical protein
MYIGVTMLHRRLIFILVESVSTKSFDKDATDVYAIISTGKSEKG